MMKMTYANYILEFDTPDFTSVSADTLGELQKKAAEAVVKLRNRGTIGTGTKYEIFQSNSTELVKHSEYKPLKVGRVS
jgi:hypothetical protein